jgi:hypothetical protein
MVLILSLEFESSRWVAVTLLYDRMGRGTADGIKRF